MFLFTLLVSTTLQAKIVAKYPIKPYIVDSTYILEIYLSADGSKCGIEYFTTHGRTVSRFVLVNNKVYENFYSVSNFKFSPQCSSFGFQFVKGNKYYLQINDKTYGGIQHSILRYEFNNNGSKFIMAYNNGGDDSANWYFDGGQNFVRVNNRIYGPFDNLDRFGFDPLGSKSVISYNNGGKRNEIGEIVGGQWWLIFGEQKLGPFVEPVYPTFIQGGNNYWFIYQKGTKEYFNINGKNYGPYDLIQWPCISNNGTKYSYVYNRGGMKDTNGVAVGGKYYVSHNGLIYGGYHFIQHLVMSADGSNFGFSYYDEKLNKYIRTKDTTYYWQDEKNIDISNLSGDGSVISVSYELGGNKYLQIGDSVFNCFDGHSWVTFNNDGTEYAYWFKQDSVCFYKTTNRIYEKCSNLCNSGFSPCRTKFYIQYRIDGKSYLQVNDDRFGPYESVFSPIFSKNDAKINFKYHAHNNIHFYIDGNEFELPNNAYNHRFETNDEQSIVQYKLQDDNEYIRILNNNVLLGPYKKSCFTITQDNEVYISYVKQDTIYIEMIY